MARQLRPYQQEAVQAVVDYWSTPDLTRYTPTVVLPTGTGKSHRKESGDTARRTLFGQEVT